MVLLVVSLVFGADLKPIEIDKTVFKDNTAFVNNSRAYISQFPHTIGKGDVAKIIFQKRLNSTEYDLCLDFPVHNSLIEIEKIEKKRFFGLFNENLGELYRDNNRICIKSFSNTGQVDLDLKMNYLGFDTIKYNISILPSLYKKDHTSASLVNELVILDPYLIGSLATTYDAILYLPFDGNITNIATNQTLYPNLTFNYNATAGYNFKKKDSTDIFQSYDGVDTAINYNSSVAYFNASNAQIVLDKMMGYNATFTLYFKDLHFNAFSHNKGIFECPNTFVARVLVGSPDLDFYFYETDGSLIRITIPDALSTFDTDDYAISANGSHFVAYKNGVKVGTPIFYDGTVRDPSGNCYLGKTTGGYSNFSLGEFYIFNNTYLNDSEILAIYENGTYVTDILGTSDSALYFNNSFVSFDIYGLTSLTAGKPFTFSVWVKPESNGELYRAIAGYNVAHRLLINADGRLLTQQAGNFWSSGNGDVPDDVWSHVVYWYDGTNEKWYVNGQQSGSTHAAAGNSWNALFYIGKFTEVDTYKYKGSMDEFIVYDCALTDTEILTLYGGWNNSINLSVYNASDISLITAENITIDLWNEDANYSQTLTTNNGYIFSSGFPNGTYRITSYGTNFDANIIRQEIVGVNSNTNINLFLTDSTSDTVKDVLLHVQDEIESSIENANIKVYKQDGSVFVKTADIYTNINGEVLTQFVKDINYYKFTVFVDGEKCYETETAFPINALDDDIYFTCILGNDYLERRDEYNDIVTYLSFSNDTNVTGNFTMEGNSTNITEYCLEIREVTTTGQGYTVINKTCENTTSFLVKIGVNATNRTRDTTFYGIALKRPQNESIWDIDNTVYHTFKILFTPDWDNLGLLITFLVMLVGFFGFIKTPQISVLWIGGTFMLVTATRFVNLPMLEGTGANIGAGVTVLAICIIIAFAISKRSST